MLLGLSSNFRNDLGIYISLTTIILIVRIARTEVQPLVNSDVIQNVPLEVIVLIMTNEAMQIIVGDEARAEMKILVTSLVKFVDVLDSRHNVIDNQSFLTLGQGNQRHLMSLFSVDIDIIEPFMY